MAALGWVLGFVCAFSSARAGTLGLPGQAEIERSELNEGNLSRLEAVFDKATKGGAVSIAALGGSITEGTGSYELSNRWSAHVADWFETTFPNATILRTNAGIGATGSRLGCHRIARDIQPANPDLVLVDFSVNDHAGENGGESMEGCVRQLLRLASNPAVLLVSMLRQDGLNVQDEHLAVSRYYALSHLSVRDAIWPRISGGEIAWSDYSGDTVHPNRDGHPYIAALVTAYLERCLKNWKDGASSAAYVFPTKPLFGTTYDSGAVVRARDLRLSANKGFVPGTDRQGTKWNGVMVGSKPGDRMAFTTDAATLTLVYWKLHADFGRVRVTVDGKPLKTLDGWFSETWGGKAETCELFRDKPGRHEVEIEVLNEKSAESNGNQFEVCAVLEQQATARAAAGAYREDSFNCARAARLRESVPDQVLAWTKRLAVTRRNLAETFANVEPGHYRRETAVPWSWPCRPAITCSTRRRTVRFARSATCWRRSGTSPTCSSRARDPTRCGLSPDMTA